jgi:hypothetical protein
MHATVQILGGLLEIDRVVNDHYRLVELWHREPVTAPNEVLPISFIMQNHVRNFQLWHVEDEARVKEVPDSVIADCKRRIDKLNQERNDFVEQVDIYLLSQLHKFHLPDESAPLHSETVGMMFDRLSILSLKLFHMNEQVQRTDVDLEHRRKCADKVEALRQQRADLQDCLSSCWRQIITGRRRFKVYRQFKMYNDDTLNMAVVAARKKLAP